MYPPILYRMVKEKDNFDESLSGTLIPLPSQGAKINFYLREILPFVKYMLDIHANECGSYSTAVPFLDIGIWKLK